IFPSSLEPLSAPFNLRQIAELARLCEVQVLEAIPHLPLASTFSFSGRAARLASLPPRERVHGVDVTYVRQLYVPRVGLPVAVPLYLASLLPHRDRLRRADVVLATWAYPDGCAAVLAARAAGKPCVVKVHGSDVNVVLQTRAARAVAARVLPMADAVVAVSRPLADELVRLGVPGDRVHLVMNGVDTALFRPRDRAEARAACGLAADARVVLFVGRLEPQKGIHELLDAFEGVRARVPRATLVMVGDGVSASDVRTRVARWSEVAREGAGEGAAARMVGPQSPAEVARWMAACDVLTLPSWAEGTPNVVLEALASGRPVVATRVGGIPDVLADPRSGLVVPPRDAKALETALIRALQQPWDDDAVRTCGQARGIASWTESAARLAAILVQARAAHEGRARARTQEGPARARTRTQGASPAAARRTTSRSSAGSLPLLATTLATVASRSGTSPPRSISRSR
ncbi:MAG TPA: glycosyltransferase family 4 protein, partial [Polyangiaceae bacterium]|nr:glycosyltransferase family 4 protein [Polyangiaceae bacterium]